MSIQQTSKRILLVDDEQDIRDVLQMALLDAGYEVQVAENGKTALECFQCEQPPIVITDIKMPVMDGIELLKRLKRENPETEVIMITGHGDMDLAIKSMKNEATDFITKPINVDGLEIALRRAEEKILIREKLKEYTTSLEALVREKSELQDHLSKLGLMIGSISHGIKGLLTGLDGGLYLLNSGLKAGNDEKVREGWETVQMMAHRIRKMVLDILFYAKKRELQTEEVDLTGFANEVVTVIGPKLEANGIELVCSLPENLHTLRMDPGYIQAALMNILENAVDACCRDSAQNKCRSIRFAVSENEEAVTFVVQDNGVGMDAETQAKLFTVFFSSKGRKGTGLGLFIANQIVEQHGGKVSVSSSPGRGSKFSIKIPKGVPAAADDEVDQMASA